MSPEFIINYFLPAVAFAIGASIGSFLNVVIYRVPNNLSVNNPRRSFCPNCKTQIPVWLNIPLFTWLMLRGKCRWCQSPIAFRYFLVELLTALIFWGIWELKFASLGIFGVIALWVFAAMLIAATFIDFDHFIIPDSITIGGTVLGLLASLALPALHHESIWWRGGLQSIIGAAIGFSLLWLVLLMGKLAFGSIKHHFDSPTEFEISQPNGEDSDIVIQLGEHRYEWSDVFGRKWDRLEMDVVTLKFNEEEQTVESSFRILPDAFELDGRRIEIDESIKKISGTITRAVVPREAMGFGDVKFIAMIGAFLGWQAVILTVFISSIVGAIVGLLQKFVFREAWARPLPYGPYLALGAFIWLFIGPAIWQWYVGLLRPGM